MWEKSPFSQKRIFFWILVIKLEWNFELSSLKNLRRDIFLVKFLSFSENWLWKNCSPSVSTWNFLQTDDIAKVNSNFIFCKKQFIVHMSSFHVKFYKKNLGLLLVTSYKNKLMVDLFHCTFSLNCKRWQNSTFFYL